MWKVGAGYACELGLHSEVAKVASHQLLSPDIAVVEDPLLMEIDKATGRLKSHLFDHFNSKTTGLNFAQDAEHILKRVVEERKIPLTYLVAEDNVNEPTLELLRKCGVEWKTVDGSGRYTMHDQPKKFWSVVGDWLERH